MHHKPFVDIQIIVWYLLFQFLSRFKELLGKCGFPHIFSHFLPVCADNTTRKSNIFTAHLAFSNWKLLAACSIWNTDDMEQASVYQCETLVLLATSGLAFTCTSAAGRMQFTPVWLNCHGSPEVPWKCNFCDVSDIVSHLFLFFCCKIYSTVHSHVRFLSIPRISAAFTFLLIMGMEPSYHLDAYCSFLFPRKLLKEA